MSISEKLKQARTESKLTQEVIAENVGVSRQTVSSWESGKSYPDIASLMILSDVYNVTLDSLLKGDTDMIRHLEEGSGKGKKAKYVIVSIVALTIGMVFIFLSYALLGADTRHFLDLPSLYLLLLPIIFILTITRSYKQFYLGIVTLIFPRKQISEEQREQTISLFRLMSKTVAIASGILTISFLITIFVGIDFTSVDFIGKDSTYTEFLFQLTRSMAILLIVPLYSLVMILGVFEPIVFILKKK
jgi:transcriptional regulator with XRE-family HTH domain